MLRRQFAVAALVATAIGLGCGGPALETPQSPSPTEAEGACAAVAPEWDGTVAAAFETTLGRIRSQMDTPAQWAAVPDSNQAFLCYIDGSIPKAPPGGPPFDRAVVVVVNGLFSLIRAGYSTQLPIASP